MSKIEESMEPRWIDAADSPWGIRVFDCRGIATTMVSTATHSDSAEQFIALRNSDGSHLYGKRPPNPVQIEVNISYPATLGSLPDRGVVFRAETLDDKWDIAVDDGVITFARSWTGEVVYNCDVVKRDDHYDVSAIVLSEDIIDESDVYYHVHVVNYLMFSHVFDVVYPHPLPLNESPDEDDILMQSFASFGRKGWFATTERFGEESSE
ncbi:MAG: hypothetical protein NTX15_08155 [Candidatus Kapabacteria bacterium]|nr:hypothetical protein [Candidatus Kapabacteria bacterium]